MQLQLLLINQIVIFSSMIWKYRSNSLNRPTTQSSHKSRKSISFRDTTINIQALSNLTSQQQNQKYQQIFDNYHQFKKTKVIGSSKFITDYNVTGTKWRKTNYTDKNDLKLSIDTDGPLPLLKLGDKRKQLLENIRNNTESKLGTGKRTRRFFTTSLNEEYGDE